MLENVVLAEGLLAKAALGFLIVVPDFLAEQGLDLSYVLLQVGGKPVAVRLVVVAHEVELALLGLLAVVAPVPVVPLANSNRFLLRR